MELKRLLILLVCIVIIPIALAVEFVPNGDINLYNWYSIKNAVDINGTEIYQNGSQVWDNESCVGCIYSQHVTDIDKSDIEGDINTFVDIDGDTMTGDLNMSSNKITNVSRLIMDKDSDIYFGDVNCRIYSGATNDIFLDATTVQMWTNDKVSMRTDGDVNDFLYFGTTSDIPYIQSYGSDLRLIPDNGMVYVDGNITASYFCNSTNCYSVNEFFDDTDTQIGNCSADQSCSNILYTTDEADLNVNNSDMVDGKHVGKSGNTIPVLDGANTWTGTNRYKETVTLSGNAQNDEAHLLMRSYHKVGFATWLPSRIYFFDEITNRASIWYRDYSGGLGIDDLTGFHIKSYNGITLNANDGNSPITLNGKTNWKDEVTIGLGSPPIGSERFLFYANATSGYLNPSCWNFGCLMHPPSFIWNDGLEDTDFIFKSSQGNALIIDGATGNVNVTGNLTVDDTIIVGGLAGLTGTYDVGTCNMTFTGGILTATDC